MKSRSSTRTRKKKRKSDIQVNPTLEAAVSDCTHIKDALPLVPKLRPRNSSSVAKRLFSSSGKHYNYKFQLTRNIKKHIHAIKRTVINQCVSEVHNLNRISISNRIAINSNSRKSKSFNEGWLLHCNNQFMYRFTRKFLKQRSIKMANSSSKSTAPFANITITFEQMLNIRKKRLEKKHQRSLSGSAAVENQDKIIEPVVDVIDQTDTSKNDENRPYQAEDKNQTITEVENDTSALLRCDSKNNNVEKYKTSDYISLDYIGKNDADVLIKQNDIIPSTCASDINTKEIGCSDFTEVNKSPEINKEVIDLASLHVDDAVINLMSETSSTSKVEETPKKNCIDDTENRSVIVITPGPNDLSSVACSDIEVKEIHQSSVIIIPDTPDSLQDMGNSDNDIIFVSEESKSTTAPRAKRRKLNRRSSVIILDDDEARSVTRVTYRRGHLKGRILKRRKTKKSRITTQKTPAVSRVTSELASCAAINCINMQNNNQALMPQTLQSCSCQRDTKVGSLIPVHLTVPEESATSAQSGGINITLQQELINSYHLHYNSNAANTFGSNIHNAGHIVKAGLRQIIIDGSNVALGHGNGAFFSVKGLQIAIDYFVKRGHKVTAFVPQYRVKFGQCSNPELLRRLNEERLVVFTPSREVKGRRITPYDDRYIIQYAATCEGIVVSNDHFRDLLREKPEWRQTIERRLLMYTWVDDVLIFPEDPLGRHGPSLSRFLKFP